MEETLELFRATIGVEARRPVRIEAGNAANFLRGQFGRLLWEQYGELYAPLFRPVWREGGPSGLKDPPRPYVIRTAGLEGRSYAAGETIAVPVHVFDLRYFDALPWLDRQRVTVPLKPVAAGGSGVRLHFETPTELKGVRGLPFGALLARLRDRVSTLERLYGQGSWSIDYREIGERAEQVREVRREVRWVRSPRVARNSGETHDVRGWVGWVEYAGDWQPLSGLLAAAEWTGVGRHTVWGCGVVRVEGLPMPAKV